ncbi:hypothetical protein [Streptomyces hydrogenans]|uniref:hypothetical protein n=1 Tax=Streptomyces hydrogenans TaxID=1873719 RepID=UPI0037FA3B70
MQRRTITPDHTETTDDGRTITVVTTKRYCDRDHLLGDATDAEIQAAIDGRPLPDVSSECHECEPRMTDQPASSLTAEVVSAILRDPDSPLYPTQITVFCDHCGREATRDYMVSDSMTSTERLAAARTHLAQNEGWQHDEDGDDFCPEHAAA